MLIKSLLAISATATTVIAGENNIKFLYTSSSFNGIHDSGSGHIAGFTLFDNDNNILFQSANPIGYAPCMRDTNHLQITSDCWEGTYDFSCGSSFSGMPGACSVYAPDKSETKGEVDKDLTFIGIASGEDGTCSGTITTQSDGECTKDSLVKIERRYTGKYAGDD
ncbi:hypothetical protein N7519_007229 [Penicillium mononematosum]|uniref:uncharacterized protein n=1 Tax=Penicillium mononematosum TaxID=268346 RepID=UPI00254900C7|nr:uncharacterized protein N7519_007229 [Penicillium mononematosum]KAJ6185928.1 hypothetical protein N7519_007229 [Penicillium mononematosum]